MSEIKPTSKAQLCRDYYAANPGLARKDYIKAFCNLGMTKKGAETYHQQIKAKAKAANGAVEG